MACGRTSPPVRSSHSCRLLMQPSLVQKCQRPALVVTPLPSACDPGTLAGAQQLALGLSQEPSSSPYDGFECHPSDGDVCCRVRRPALRPAAHCPAPCSRWFGVQSKNHLGCHQNRGFCQQNRGFRQDGVPIAPPWWCLSHVSHVQQSALGLHCGDVQLKLCHFEFEGFDVSHYHTICINLPHFV
jgi:hypothetical protein